MPLNISPNSLTGNPVVSFSGLGSGFDTNAIVSARVGIDKQQIAAIQAQENLLTSRQNVYNKVGASLQALQNVAQTLNAATNILPASASASDATVLAAAAGSGAAKGSYDIVVNTRAKAQSNFSSAFSSASQAGLLTPGALNISVANNNPFAFNITSDTTLQSLADEVNAGLPDVAATVINDGSGYRLSITGRDTGAINTLTFTDAGTGLNLEDNVEQTAQDASLTINNSLNVTSASNTISNAISGVTLQAVSASPTKQTVTIGADSSGLSTDVKNLVGAYNAVVSTINQASQFTGSYDPTSLIGDAALRTLQNELQDTLDAVSPTAKGAFSALSQLGVSSRSDGTLAIDQNQLNAAIQTDPDSVAALLSNSADASQTGVAGQLGAVAQSYGAPITGVLSQLSQGIGEQNNASDDRISDMQNAVNTYQGTLRQQFVSLEVLMSELDAQNQIVAAFAYQTSGQTSKTNDQTQKTQDSFARDDFGSAKA